ncbi:MAG: polysaccharide deacetylase family protein [Actinobacteria bacterium]|nr:polysaccharide deacetylase family protein [Actinomycetota bacterium]
MPALARGARARGATVLVSLALALGALALIGAASARGGFDGGTVVGASEAEPFGCTSVPAQIARRGPRGGDEVALSFDDGPSRTQTPAILETLVRLGARATFFEEGRHVRGREALMRQILAAGEEIGNHSFHHPVDPGPAELRSTNEAIRAATGFEPCLFRPPYGELDRRVKEAALANGLQTVFWTLDSEDDAHPGVGAIRARVVRRARPGSIVLLHDGGHHPQTVAALPGIVEGLEARGFRLVTVTELLGGRMLYRR